MKGFCRTAAITMGLLLAYQGFGRDGTLPIQMDGIVIERDALQHSASIIFHDNAIIPGSANRLPCRIQGSGVRKFDAAGEVVVGNVSYSIIGTCKDERSNQYEVLAHERSNAAVNLVGQVSNASNNVIFKGGFSVSNTTYRFDLR